MKDRLLRTARLGAPAFVAIASALAAGALLMLATGHDPIAAYRAMVDGALGGRGFANLLATLARAVPIVGMGLAAAIALRGGFLNLGGEGQLVLGGVAAALVALYAPLPAILLLPATLLGGALAGSAWAYLATVLERRFHVALLIGTLLLNYPARYLASYLASHPLRDVASGMAQTFRVPAAIELPQMAGGRLHAGAFLILALVLASHWILRRTRVGYELRMTGLNPRFARYGGVDTRRLGRRAMLTSGAIAGLVGSLEVLGTHHRFIDGALTGPLYAWTGLMAALLAGSSPLGVLAAGLFFAGVHTGGFGMERGADVPRELSRVLQALMILLIA
ncbi:MAG: ABC transporter permease, partial [Acidobacteriota bacterium]